MRVRRFLIALLTLGTFLGPIAPVAASALSPVESRPNEIKNKGLYLAPLRTYLSVEAGSTTTRAFTVANRTSQPMTVTTSLEAFSVADYSYDYRFDAVNNDWVQITEHSFTLKPFESRAVPYRVTLPKSAGPGGHYYTLYASSTTPSGTTNSTIRAASLLYLTVKGELKRSSEVIDRSLPWLVVTPDIRYSLDIKNTGNVHYFGYFESAVRGLTYHDSPNGSSQLLMPGTVRHIENSIRSPLIPGVYRLTYSYTPDEGQTINGSHYFLFLPPWSIALLIILLAVTTHLTIYRLRQKRSKKPSDSDHASHG